MCLLCLRLNTKMFPCQRPLRKIRFFQKILPLEMRTSFKASCFLPNKAMDHKLIPFQRVVLTLQDATNPGPVAQFVRMQCSFKVHGAFQWKWAPYGYGGLPFNNPLTQSGNGKDATKLCLGTKRRHAVTIHRQRQLWVSRAVTGTEVSYTTWGTPIT